MKKLVKLWYQTRDKNYTIKDRIKNFFWVVRHPFLTVRLSHYALKVLRTYHVDIEDLYRRR